HRDHGTKKVSDRLPNQLQQTAIKLLLDGDMLLAIAWLASTGHALSLEKLTFTCARIVSIGYVNVLTDFLALGAQRLAFS
ncbi:MAG: hypothetical protein ACP5XB_26230, partial [Isosphaeraceae bacterium]